MDVSPNALRRETLQLLNAIDKQINAVAEFANAGGISTAQVRDADGGWAMSPLLSAKAQCIHTLALLRKA